MSRVPLVLCLSCLTSLPGQGDPWTERKLATIPDGLELSTTSTTSTGPDGRQYTGHTTFVFGAGGRFVADTAHRGPPVCAADGKNVAFGARTDRELWWRVMALE